MSKPYLILSDIHLHQWTAFATIGIDGVSSRLQQILDAIREAAWSLRAAGGDHIFLAGDIFHKRGSIEPAVLNTTMDVFKQLVDEGFIIYGLPGNHDMTANDSQRVGNAVTALESVGVQIAHAPMVVSLSEDHKVVLFPWYSTVSALIGAMTDLREDLVEDTIVDDCEPFLDAIIHAPIDGVLPHLPTHGLTAGALNSTGFNRVFSGHYHNHKAMGDDVYSIGALVHHCWGDIDSRAGWMIVDRDEVWQHQSSHPKFVELTGDETDDEAEAKCCGNYVRVRVEIEKDSELKEIRDGVMKMGALGCVVLPQRKSVVARAGVVTSASSVSVEAGIKSYLDKKSASAAVHALALDILSEARAS